ncbi:MAG TPA: metal ABC transporter substrate-binding protein [Gemmatimonadales bacterium]|nr:metal ABC transporter substrate-binding protein [Gemmatimonadales bacterium]
MSRNVWLALAASLLLAAPATAKLRVGASTQDLASIAASVGGEQVEVFAIARPSSDAHRIEALPSYMVSVSRAQVYLKVGLGLDQWAGAIVDGSRNSKLTVVDCSAGVRVLEKPTGKVDASMGDVHPQGNPHYWLDPRNGAVVAKNVADALAKADPANAAAYRARATAFATEAQAVWERNAARARALGSPRMFTYHRSWSYFADAFGFEVVDTVEPVPGIPPTARHLAALVEQARARQVKLLLQEPYFASDAGRFLERQAGVRPVVQATSCAEPKAGSYLKHFDEILAAMEGGAR